MVGWTDDLKSCVFSFFLFFLTKKWNDKRNNKNAWQSLGLTGCSDVQINGLTSLNSQMFHVVINECQNVKVQGVKVSASGDSPNTDGIHVQASSGVTILDAKIETGDDCVSIGPGASKLWIENVACGPGHGIRYTTAAPLAHCLHLFIFVTFSNT